MKNRMLYFLTWTLIPIGVTWLLLEYANYNPVAVMIAIVFINFVGFLEGLTKKSLKI